MVAGAYVEQGIVDLACDWVAEFRPADVPERAREIAKELVCDALGCAAASCSESAVEMLRRAIAATGGAGACSVIGEAAPAALADAVLLNGTMTRAQDFNDAYVRGPAVGHPSDNVAGLLAVAERSDISGRRFLDAMILTSEIYCRLIDHSEAGSDWDHSALSAVALPLGLAWMLGLERSTMRAAVSLTACFARPSSEVRRGMLSPAKAMANAVVASAACTFTYMARAGMGGPTGALDGAAGWARTVGAGMDLSMVFGEPLTHCRVEDVSIKAFPCIGTAQGAVAAAVAAHPRFVELDFDALTILVELPHSALKESQVVDQDRWHPTTRETADHSIPYLVAAALLEGEVTAEQLDRRLWAQEHVGDVMARVSLSLEHGSPLGLTGARVTVASPNRPEIRIEVQDAPGDPRNPIRGRDLRDRVARNMNAAWEPAHCDEIVETLDAIDELASVRELTTLLRAETRHQ